MPLPHSSMGACLYWNEGVESVTGSLAASFFLMAVIMSSIASMPGASSHPHVAAKQLLKHCSRFCRPVAKLLIFTGWMFTDHGIAALSSFGPGLTPWPTCASAASPPVAFCTQPRAHVLSLVAHRRPPPPRTRKLGPFLATA